MAGWGSGLSLTPRLLVTSHEGQSLDCTSAAETSGSPDFLHISFFSPVKAHLMGAGRGKGLTLHESGLEECLWEGRKIFHCPLHTQNTFIHQLFNSIQGDYQGFQGLWCKDFSYAYATLSLTWITGWRSALGTWSSEKAGHNLEFCFWQGRQYTTTGIPLCSGIMLP